MDFDTIRSPLDFMRLRLNARAAPNALDVLSDEEVWWDRHGKAISDSVDRAGTPWLRMFDSSGVRVDQILFAPDYYEMLRRGYRAGVLWRSIEERSAIHAYALLYQSSFYDPGICCPYTVSLATAIALWKYGSEAVRTRFLPPFLQKDGENWQGATWMTEIKGGSDLGANVETIATPAGDRHLLTGDKYFASNVGAEGAIVAARPEGAARGIRGVALFFVPRRRNDGALNYFVRRLKDKIATRSVPTGEVELRESEAYLVGPEHPGIHLILETLNLSRVANSIASVALAQRVIADAFAFANQRVAFGKKIFDQPLLHRQFKERGDELCAAFALAWEAVERMNDFWLERPPYSERYQLFRLIAHLAKYWTAEFAVQTAKWGMEVHGGLGVLGEFRAERWLREAMILSIWEGTSHRQILDGLEVMERKRAHLLLLKRLDGMATASELQDMEAHLENHLRLPAGEREAQAEQVFHTLAAFTARALRDAGNPKP